MVDMRPLCGRAGSLILFGIHPFLAISQRTEAEVLVVEGWVHAYALRAALEEFENGSYRRVFTTGGPVRVSDVM